ncbi:MAG TPA: phosphotransferase [Novosphingobium sp.]|nr:phosphotransferase [Novosphingobium sp.]
MSGTSSASTAGVSARDQVTAEWLGNVLGEAGFDRPRVRGFSIAPVGTGQAAEACRILLEYDDPHPDLPRSMVAKFPSDNPASRQSATQGGIYMREVRFYQDMQAQCTIKTPRCYHAWIEGNGPEFALLLEDLAPASQGDQIAGCDEHVARKAVLELVGLHAPTWGKTALLEADWLSYASAPDRAKWVMAQIYKKGLPHFMERCAGGLEPEEVRLMERLAQVEDYPSEFPRLKTWCINHNDFRLDNFLIDESRTPMALDVVDWATVGAGNPMRDMSYFLGGCLLPDQRLALEKGLVGEYHDALTAAGVSDYSWEACWSDYRQSSFHGLMNAVAAMVFVTRTERGDKLFTVMAQRHLRQALELGAEEFVR